MEKRVLFLDDDEICDKAKEKGINIEYVDGDKGNFSVKLKKNDKESIAKYCEIYKGNYGLYVEDTNKLLSDIFDVEVEDVMTSDGDQDFPYGWIMAILK